jgi:hypothetical protein
MWEDQLENNSFEGCVLYWNTHFNLIQSLLTHAQNLTYLLYFLFLIKNLIHCEHILFSHASFVRSV